MVIDAGCGEGQHAIGLARRFGFTVAGFDPVRRQVERARAAAGQDGPGGLTGPVFAVGRAEQLPVRGGAADLIWCRDMLVHVSDLREVFAEFGRVLRPGGRVLMYQMFAADRLEAREAAWLWAVLGVVPGSADPAAAEAAITAAGLRIDQRIVVGTEWGEWAQERDGAPGRKLLHAARLLRGRDGYVARYGQAAYDMMLGDCLWHVYAMIGKLSRRVYLLSRP